MYYTIRIQRKKDGTEVRNIAPYENKDEAEIFYHKCLAADMSNTDMKSCIMMVLSEDCSIVLSRHWVSTANELVEE